MKQRITGDEFYLEKNDKDNYLLYVQSTGAVTAVDHLKATGSDVVDDGYMPVAELRRNDEGNWAFIEKDLITAHQEKELYLSSLINSENKDNDDAS